MLPQWWTLCKNKQTNLQSSRYGTCQTSQTTQSNTSGMSIIQYTGNVDVSGYTNVSND